jgi:hypothetical protein
MRFFDSYPRFYQTSAVGAAPNRLHWRHRALIEANLDCIQGKTILDLASHDGRWSFAALKAGAAHATGIEARPHLAARARETFLAYEVPASQYSFINGDVYSHLGEILPDSIDTVFCFGFFYHTMHHQWLLKSLAALRPANLILDTRISLSADPVIEVRFENPDNDQAVVAAPGDAWRTSLVGHPSRRAIEMMLDNFGFSFRYFDWMAEPIDDWDRIEDYRDGLRVTLRAAFRSPVT